MARVSIAVNETNATRRRVPIDLVALVDGYTPVPAVVPTITVSVNGAAYAAAAGAAPAATGAEGDTYYELAASEVTAGGYVRVLATDGLVLVRDDIAQVEITDGVNVKSIDAGPVTTIQTGLATAVALAAVSAQLPALLVGGRIDASVGAVATNALSAAGFSAAAIAAIQSGLATAASITALGTRIPAALSGGGFIKSIVMEANVNTLTAAAAAPDFIAEVAGGVVDLNLTTHTIANTLGERMYRIEGFAAAPLGSTTFGTSLTQTESDFCKDALVLWIDGALAGEVKRVFAYDGITKQITMSTPFTTAPTAGDRFLIINQ